MATLPAVTSIAQRARDAIVGQRRALVVFVLAVLVLGALAGERMLTPSANNHFVHLADGWLDGRTALEDKPPGWCASKDKRGNCIHRYDDYARVQTLRRRDGQGEPMRAYPCKTAQCRDLRRNERIDRWYVLGQGWVDFQRREVTKVADGDTWYITFPPGPAVAMLPLVALFGLGTLDVLLTVLAGAAIAAVLVAWLDALRGVDDGRGVAHLLAAAAWTLASPALWLAANGQVWFTAQIFAALFTVLYLACGLRGRYPALAGLCLGMAVACRPTAALPAVLVFVAWWWRAGRPWGAALRFGATLGACGLALALHNYVRFDDPLEFGHRFLEIRWQARIQETGLFSLEYLERNLRCMLTLLPVSDPKVPWRVSIHGSAIWVGAPWLFAIVFARRKFDGRGALWVAAALAAVPALLYQNSGQIQYSYRFALDWLPLVLVAMTVGGAFDRPARGFGAPRFAWLLPAIALGAVFQGWGAYNFERAKGKVFVTKPMGWPFEDELESG